MTLKGRLEPVRPDRAKLLYVLAAGGRDAMVAVAEEMGYEHHPPIKSRPKDLKAPDEGQMATQDTGGMEPKSEILPLDPVRFFRPVAREYRETLDGDVLPPAEPTATEVVTEEDLEAGSGTGSSPQVPLSSWPRVWRLLEDRLRTPRPRRQIDVERLVRELARGETVRRIPRRQGLAHAPVLVIVDSSDHLLPVWGDQRRVLNRLVDRLGRHRVRAMTTKGLKRSAPSTLGNNERVLALTDLGSLGSTEDRDAWLRLGEDLARRSKLLPVALMAAPQWAWPKQAAKIWQTVAWEPPRRVEGEGRRHLDPALTLEKILVRVSPAQRLETGLVRSVCRLVGADVSYEIALWSHPDVQHRNVLGIALEPEAAKRWRLAFRDLEEREKEEVARLLGAWHRNRPETLAAEAADLLACGAPSTSFSPEQEEAVWTLMGKICRRVACPDAANPALNEPTDAWFARWSQWSSMELWSAPQIRGDVEEAAKAFRRRYPDAPKATGTTPEVMADSAHELGEPSERVIVQDAVGIGAVSTHKIGSRIIDMKARGPIQILDVLGSGETLAKGIRVAPPDSPQMRLVSDLESVVLEAWEPTLDDVTSWAIAVGRDHFGLWGAFEVEGVRQRLRWIPPGRFWMGSLEEEIGRDTDEGPRHSVTLEQGFWLAETPCTQHLWEAVMGENPSEFKGKSRPVESVNWQEIQEFLERLNQRFRHLEVRLPTEAEWEYGCRAGTQGAHWLSGASSSRSESTQRLREIAWFRENSDGSTHNVASKPPNPWGLYDSLGNVYEWCWDRFGSYSETPTVDPEGPEGAPGRVIRGGSWGEHARFVRAAYRDGGHPGARDSGLGFRLSRGQVPKLRGAENKGPRTSSEQARRGTSLRAGARRSMAWIERLRWASEGGVDSYGRWVRFQVEGASQTLRWIVPGRFQMGSPEDEAGWWSNEGPQHEVKLSRGFWLADTPCTQALWEAVMGANPSHFQSPRRPVEGVSWKDVQEFLARLGSLVPGLDPEIPTEAQWEYACRAGTDTATWKGNLEILGERHAPRLDSIAWYGGNSGVGFELPEGEDSSGWREVQFPRQISGSREVALKQANPWGLYDMLGNVYEWCRDGERSYQPGSVLDPIGPDGTGRVFRGGSWDGHARDVRAACRHGIHPGARFSGLGFRLSRGPRS